MTALDGCKLSASKSRPLYLEVKTSCCSMNMMLDTSQDRSERCCEEKISLPQLRIEPQFSSFPALVLVTELLLHCEKDATFIIRETCTFLLVSAKIWSILKLCNYRIGI
jgi:hypothetical protein